MIINLKQKVPDMYSIYYGTDDTEKKVKSQIASAIGDKITETITLGNATVDLDGNTIYSYTCAVLPYNRVKEFMNFLHKNEYDDVSHKFELLLHSVNL